MFRFLIALIALMMLVQFNPPAQSQKPEDKNPRLSDLDVLTRIAYRNTFLIKGQNLHQACFALYRDGYFQLLRIKHNGAREDLQGYLQQREMTPVIDMLKKIEFGKSIGGAVMGDSEVFMADVATDDNLVRHAWLDPDGRRPMPESATAVVSWLQNFKPKSASRFVPGEMSFVCPGPQWETLPESLQPATLDRSTPRK